MRFWESGTRIMVFFPRRGMSGVLVFKGLGRRTSMVKLLMLLNVERSIPALDLR